MVNDEISHEIIPRGRPGWKQPPPLLAVVFELGAVRQPTKRIRRIYVHGHEEIIQINRVAKLPSKLYSYTRDSGELHPPCSMGFVMGGQLQEEVKRGEMKKKKRGRMARRGSRREGMRRMREEKIGWWFLTTVFWPDSGGDEYQSSPN